MAKRKISISQAHHLIATTMGVPQASVETERMLTRAAREGAGVPYIETDTETAYGSTQRMQRSIRVF